MDFISTDFAKALPSNRDCASSRNRCSTILPLPSLLFNSRPTVERIYAQLDKPHGEKIKILRAARDLLLPRLMSGELAV